ncbi:MAG: enoyl-CoA hydratase/isomerase family protein [Mycobacterium sp.]|jgi:enoyl-CoA hydratase/carnithine racemase
MAESLVMVEVRDRIGFVTLNDPGRRNALGPDLLASLGAAWAQIEQDRSVRAVVLRATGSDFCAGGDIATFDLGVGGGREYVYETIGAFRRIEHCRKPVVASVRGRALGGGFELAMACDLVVASADARFALPELSVGAVPAFALVRLGEIVGRSRAKQIAWSGRRVDAVEAQGLGLVCTVVDDSLDDSALDDATEQQARQLVELPRIAAETVKAAFNREIADRALFESTTTAAMLWGTEGIAEGRRAFYEKRPPRFPDE